MSQHRVVIQTSRLYGSNLGHYGQSGTAYPLHAALAADTFSAAELRRNAREITLHRHAASTSSRTRSNRLAGNPHVPCSSPMLGDPVAPRRIHARWIEGSTPTKYGKQSSTKAIGLRALRVSTFGLTSVATLSVACTKVDREAVQPKVALTSCSEFLR